MALTKKMLQAMEIAEEKIDQIIEGHRESINGLTAERDTLKEERDRYKAEADRLADVEKELVKAQAKLEDAEADKKELVALKKEYEDYKADISAKETRSTKEKAYRALLAEAGIPEKRFNGIMKIADLDAVEIDADGKVKDAKKILDDIKSEWADFIVTKGTQGAGVANPPQNTGGNTFDSMSLADKMAYANENPEAPEVVAWLGK